MRNDTSAPPWRYIIDRFEDEDWAVLEVDAGVTFDVPSSWLPESAREGDVLLVTIDRQTDSAELRFVLDKGATEERRERVQSKLERLRRRPS